MFYKGLYEDQKKENDNMALGYLIGQAIVNIGTDQVVSSLIPEYKKDKLSRALTIGFNPLVGLLVYKHRKKKADEAAAELDNDDETVINIKKAAKEKKTAEVSEDEVIKKTSEFEVEVEG